MWRVLHRPRHELGRHHLAGLLYRRGYRKLGTATLVALSTIGQPGIYFNRLLALGEARPYPHEVCPDLDVLKGGGGVGQRSEPHPSVSGPLEPFATTT